MTVAKVPNPHMQSDSAPERGVAGYYVHVFDPIVRLEQQAHMIPHNKRLRTPPDPSQWPTLTIFTFIYATAVLKWWGIDHYLGAIRADYGSKFYSPSVGSNRDGGAARVAKDREERTAKKTAADTAQDLRAAGRGWDEQELLMLNLLAFQERIRGVMTDPVRKAEAEAERTRQKERVAVEKVRNWMEQVV